MRNFTDMQGGILEQAFRLVETNRHHCFNDRSAYLFFKEMGETRRGKGDLVRELNNRQRRKKV